jgi:uncharacterized protein YbjT (DUF2867 family)
MQSKMKIVITGSLGHISKPLTDILVKDHREVTVISSSMDRQPAIEALGAIAAIGSMNDVEFLTETFSGADIVYCMESLGHGFFFDQNLDLMTAIANIGRNYKEAIERSGVKKVIHLSSIGGHTDKGVGMLASHYNVEQILATLPEDVIIKTIRPVGFYYNMLAYIPTIKATGTIIQNYGGDEKEPWVAPNDIAAVIAEEMQSPFETRIVRYIASDELSPNEVASILGKAIGKPDLKWITISDEQMKNNMINAGMNPAVAKGIVDMNAGRRTGVLYEDYYRYAPMLGPTKLTAYTKEFATVFNQSK